MSVGFTIPFALLVVVCTASMIAWSFFVAKREALERITAAADLMRRESTEPDAANRLPAIFDEMEEDDRLAHVTVVVLDERGRVLGSNRRPIPPLPGERPGQWLTTTASFGKGKVVAGVYFLPTVRKERRQAVVLIAVGFLVTAAAAGLAWVLVGRTLYPIRALAAQANAATTDALQVQLVAPSPDVEIRFLVDTLNGMLARLREDTLAREQYYAAAAHELRTPLAVLSGSIEVALSRPHEAEEYRETLADLLQETRRLITLTESLLLLNRLEMRTDREPCEEVDLANISEFTLASLEPLIRKRELKIMVCWAEIPIEAPPSHAQILVRNLLENAVRYANHGGKVTVTLGVIGRSACYRVYNDTDLSPDLDLDQLFTPFFRAEASRNAATGGNGLGLSICKALAKTHGWRLTLEREAMGMSATVTFGDGNP